MNGNNKTTPSSNAVNRQQTKLIEQEQQKELINEVLKSVDQDLQKDSPDNQTAPQLNKVEQLTTVIFYNRMINLRKKMFDYLNRQEKVSKKGIIVPYKQKRILVWNVKKGL